MKKILLINPHETSQDGYTNPPLGLLYLAGTLLKEGFSVRVIDGCLDGKEAIEREIKEFSPDLVGIPCLTPFRKKAIEVAKMVKDFNSAIQTVLGGAHPTIMYHQLLEHYDCIDLVILGEGENTLLEIVQGESLERIAGIAYREMGKVKKNFARKNILELDQIPFPAWHLVNLSRYRARGKGMYRGIDLAGTPRVSVIFSRGCTGRCDFCSTWWIWKGWRHRTPTNMADELELLYHNFGIRHFCFADDAFSVDRIATMELCEEIIRRKLIIAFHVTTRTDCVDEQLLQKMEKAGCYEVAYGVETGSQQLLNGMAKKNTITSAEKAIQITKKVGLKATALMIVGNIGETEETVRETLAFLKRAAPDQVASAGGLWILPGTKVYHHCKKRGFIVDDFWLTDEPYKVYTHEHSLEWLAAMTETLYSYSLSSKIGRLRNRMVAIIAKLLSR